MVFLLCTARTKLSTISAELGSWEQVPEIMEPQTLSRLSEARCRLSLDGLKTLLFLKMQ